MKRQIVSLLTLFTTLVSILPASSLNNTYFDANDTGFINYTFLSNCSAINSFVAILSPSLLRDTLDTAQALFAPYSYHLESTELIQLDEVDNNACYELNNNLTNIELTTNVTNKVVMIWSGSDYGNGYTCSDESKVFILEQNGAVGVLIANNQDVDEVKYIPVDNDLEDLLSYTPSIPARMIEQQDGWIIENYFGSDEEHDPLIVEISCYDNSYPPRVCIVDTDGDVFPIDGEYVQEGSDILTYNDHPVYRKEGYFGFDEDLYMFLKEGDTDASVGGWFWVISYTLGSTDEEDMLAFCNDSVTDPAACKTWLSQNVFSIDPYAYNVNNDILVSDSVCNYSHSYICIESEQYAISGLGGTYKRETDNIRIWYRELSKTDLSPAIIWPEFWWWEGPFGTFFYVLVDTVDGNAIAACDLGLSIPNNPAKCDEWYVLFDSTTDTTTLYRDRTFSATKDVCDDYLSDSSNTTDTSDENINNNDTSICVGGVSVNHAFIEGTYYLSNDLNTGDLVWYAPHLENSNFKAYMYYYGDINPDYSWWVIGGNASSNNHDSEYANDLAQYAYCAAEVNHPADCQACWYFYYDGYYDADCEFYVKRGECTEEESSNSSTPVNFTASDLPQKLCLQFDVSRRLNSFYSGTYQISSTRINGQYYWSQIINNNGYIQNGSYYVSYDDLFGYWVYGYELNGYTTAYYKCDSSHDDPNPADCPEWTDYDANEVIDLTIGEYDCNISVYVPPTPRPSDTPTMPTTTTTTIKITTIEAISNTVGKSKTTSVNNNAGTTAGIIIGVILSLCLLVCIGYYCFMKNKSRGVGGFGAPDIQDDDNEMELPQRMDNKGLMSDDGNTKTGTMGEQIFDESDHDNNEDDNNNNNNDNNESDKDDEDDDIIVPDTAGGVTAGGDDDDEDNSDNGNENEKDDDGAGNEGPQEVPTGWSSFD